MTRNFWLLVHRWGGLLMAVPLIIVGLTGAILAFDSEVNHLVTPERYAAPQPGVPTLTLDTLAARAQALVPPEGAILMLQLGPENARAMIMPPRDMAAMTARMKGGLSLSMLIFGPGDVWKDSPFRPFMLYLDPWTGKVLDKQTTGGGLFGEGVMPFIHQLHDRLALGFFGDWVIGLIALLWTLDCFVAYYLTFPISRRREGQAVTAVQSWWSRWKPSWKIKANASTYRLNLDLHRASGLWLWPLLFVFAWSSVQFKLRPVYDVVTGAVFEYRSPREQRAQKQQQTNRQQIRLEAEKYSNHGEPLPKIGELLATARRLAGEEGLKRNINLGEPSIYLQQPGSNLVSVNFLPESAACQGESVPQCMVTVMFDARSGSLVQLTMPEQQSVMNPKLPNEPVGNFVTRWLFKLHKGQGLGLWYRILVCVSGIVIAMLSVTGVYLWWKKRRVRTSGVRSAELTVAEA